VERKNAMLNRDKDNQWPIVMDFVYSIRSPKKWVEKVNPHRHTHNTKQCTTGTQRTEMGLEACKYLIEECNNE